MEEQPTVADRKAAVTIELPAAVSITHLHLLAAVNTELKTRSTQGAVRVCDVGCGDGQFLGYMRTCLPLLNPGLEFEFYGFDVSDSGVQNAGFFDGAISRLTDQHPDVNWVDRLKLIGSSDPWPFESASLDIVTSNQVLEHVADPDRFMSELHRTLNDGGLSLHLFPLKHYIWEGHIFMPFVHRIVQHDRVRAWIKLCSKMGLGSYKAHRDQYGMSLDYYAEEHADYMFFMTNYKSDKEIIAYCKNNKLRADFSYTKEFYFTKLRSLAKSAARYIYDSPAAFWDGLSFPVWKRLSSVTLRIRKKNIYSR